MASGPLDGLVVRSPREADYLRVCQALDQWWDLDGIAGQGAQRTALLPRLFLQHFADTSFLVEDGETLAAFLVGFFSPTERHVGYIHFVGVAPAYRQRGLARALYERFFDLCRQHARREVHCITSPPNLRSVAFHRRLGFNVDGPVADYDGPGRDRYVFARYL